MVHYGTTQTCHQSSTSDSTKDFGVPSRLIYFYFLEIFRFSVTKLDVVKSPCEKKNVK